MKHSAKNTVIVWDFCWKGTKRPIRCIICERGSLRQRVIDAIEVLPEREKKVLTLYY